MFSGHVDRVTRHFIAGWAADLRYPNNPVDVIIIVNCEKIAQVTCDTLRTDLRDLGIYGEGKHGFRYEFSCPLPDDAEVRVTTRSATSGIALQNGDVVFPRKSAEAIIVPPPNAFVIPAPSEPNTLFRIFDFYEKAGGIPALLCRFNFANIRRAQLEYAAFGEIGPNTVRRESWTEQEARDYLEYLLHSQRFQKNIISNILHAYPEKSRIIFLHIPKCAGSDLQGHLARQHPFVTYYWCEESWTRKADLFYELCNLVRELAFSHSILVSGHVSLDYYASRGLIRPADRIFTVIRDPLEIAISAINYLLTQFETSINTRRIFPDVKNWISMLEINALPSQMTAQFAKDISVRALRNPEIVRPNSLCYWLGEGDIEAVVKRLAQITLRLRIRYTMRSGQKKNGA